jgi:uncharacterized protein (TIGR00369 family)
VPTIEQIQALLAPLFPGLLGIKLIEFTAERVAATLEVRAGLCTTGEMLHGGAQMAGADTLGAVGTFTNLQPNARTTTIESSTRFLRSVPLGSTVKGTCTALHRGRTTMVWQTNVTSVDAKLCAAVTQTQLVVAA